MTTTSRIDAELAAWLAGVRCDQAGAVLDAYADLNLANDAAKAVKDKRPPIGDATHEALNVLLDRIVGA